MTMHRYHGLKRVQWLKILFTKSAKIYEFETKEEEDEKNIIKQNYQSTHKQINVFVLVDECMCGRALAHQIQTEQNEIINFFFLKKWTEQYSTKWNGIKRTKIDEICRVQPHKWFEQFVTERWDCLSPLAYYHRVHTHSPPDMKFRMYRLLLRHFPLCHSFGGDDLTSRVNTRHPLSLILEYLWKINNKILNYKHHVSLSR